MKKARKAAPAATPEGQLALKDCEVTAARGFLRADGGLAFSGLLWIRGIPVAEFSNDGRGGCHSWVIRPAAIAAVYYREFEELAKREITDSAYEQADHLVGPLWDANIMKQGRH